VIVERMRNTVVRRSDRADISLPLLSIERRGTSDLESNAASFLGARVASVFRGS